MCIRDRLARNEADARARAESQLRDASQEARRRLGEADTEVAEVRRLRARVTNQLATLRESLADLPSLDAFPDEPSDEALPGRAGEHDGAAGPSRPDGAPDARRAEQRDEDARGSYGARSAAATSS